MNEEKRLRQYITLGFVGLSVIIVGIVWAVYNNVNKPDLNPNQTATVDPISGTSVLNTDGKTPETYGRDPDAPAILGISVLHDRGMSQTGTDSIVSVLNDYASQQLSNSVEKIMQFSIAPDTITHTVDPSVGTSTYTINIVGDNKTNYSMTVSSDNIVTAQISLFKNGSTTPLISLTKNI